MPIQPHSFAEACYNMSSVEELREALKGKPCRIDMAAWNINARQWYLSIELALKERLLDV